MSATGGIDTHNLVSSKENIQPLRHGRNTSILCAALQAENDAELHQKLENQRKFENLQDRTGPVLAFKKQVQTVLNPDVRTFKISEFEIKLRSNTSEDPLSDWCEYISWIEQSFPKQAREGKLNVVLRKCINKFKNCEQYLNDKRFVRLCIKYADCEENTVELLSQMHRHGIGVSCAEMYITWAEKYVVDNCFKKANAIYERGLQCQAQPIDLLKEAHQNFQAFLVRKLVNEGEIFQPTELDSNPAESRQPYNALQSVTAGRKEVVPSVRTGLNVLGAAGKIQQISNKEQKLKNNKMIKIYEDSENACSLEEPKARIEKLQSKKSMTKENTVKPGPWTNKQKKNVPFSVEPAGAAPFQVHRDEDDESNLMKCRNVPSSVLKSHKTKPSYEDENFENAPLFYPEPFDPTRKSMYCKEQIYAGGLEFQFEELRAIQYRKKREELLSKRMRALEPFRESLGPLSIGTETPSSCHFDAQTKPDSERKKAGRKPLVPASAPVQSEPPKPNDVFENQENLPSTDYSMNQTIHTKEALSEMQQLWFSKPASPVSVIVEPMRPAGKSILKPNKPCFSLYVDESCLDNLKTENQDKPLDLTLKCDSQEAEDLNPPSGVRKKKLANKPKPQLENCKENVFVAENVDAKKVTPAPEVDDSDKENGVPADYCGPVGKSDRKVSGILTPAENVEIAQLSDEEVEVEVDEDEDDAEPPNDYFIGRFNRTEITENFTKEFQHPRGESTPYFRKSLRNKEDCNESVFVAAEKTAPMEVPAPETNEKSGGINDKTIVIQSSVRKPALGGEGENFTKNLSVIAESSREYRTSSSGSSGTSTLPLRHSKNFPFTPSEIKGTKTSPASSHRTKGQSYTGYEASSEFSQTLRSPPGNGLNITYDLMNKLNAIESLSITNEEDEEVKEKKPEVKSEEDIDPFSESVIAELLKGIEFPKDDHWDGYLLFEDKEMPPPRVGSSLVLGPEKFEIKKALGAGAYARIFKLLNTRNNEVMIGKYQKPAFPWEFYIAREVRKRVGSQDLVSHFMDVDTGYFFKNASILLTRPVEYGDLLMVINKMKQAQIMCQTLAMYFTCQILKILETLHSCKIIHGDVKPDNFLLRMWNGKLQLQVIDFGRSIDMSLFPGGTTFKRIVTTEGFTTVEMRLGKPWSYQIDYYGVANCSHCLLFGDYMKVVEKRGVWSISKDIPRYWAKTEWRNFFKNLINIESCENLPNLSELRETFEGVLEESSEFELNLFKLKNLLNNC